MLALAFAPGSVAAEAGPEIDHWRLQLVQCLPSELECERQLSSADWSNVSLESIGNLRAIAPWFYGRATLRARFNWDGSSDPGILRLPALGSADRTYINSTEIGRTGNFDEWLRGRIASGWSAPRAYRAAPAVLLRGANEIRIEFVAFDHGAGLFRGPARFESLDSLYFLYDQWLYEYLPQAVTLLFAFNMLFFLVAFVSRVTTSGLGYFFVSSAAYIPFGAYFIHLPLVTDHLRFWQISLAGGLVSAFFAALVFLRFLGMRAPGMERAVIVAAIVLALAHLAPSTYAGAALLAGYVHVLVFAALLSVALFFVLRIFQDPPNRRTLGLILPAAAGGALINGYDLLVRLRLIDGPFLFQYAAYSYMVVMLALQSYQVVRERTRAEESEAALRDERQRLARDLHDVMGSELTRVTVEMQVLAHRHPELGALEDRVRISLSQLRDLVHLLLNPNDIRTSLEKDLESFAARLRESELFQVETRIQSVGTLLSAESALHLHRICMEWLSNVVRHGNARRIAVFLRPMNGRVRLQIRSDGQGFSWRAGQTSVSGYGLRNINYRLMRAAGRARSIRKGDSLTVFSLSMPMLDGARARQAVKQHAEGSR